MRYADARVLSETIDVMEIVYERSENCLLGPRPSTSPPGLPEKLVAVRRDIFTGLVPTTTYLAAHRYPGPTPVALFLR